MAILDFIKDLFTSSKDVTQGDILSEFRKQYPVYTAVSDPDLAKALSAHDPQQYSFLSNFDPKASVSPDVTPMALRDEAFYGAHPEIGQKDAVAAITDFKTKYPAYANVTNETLAPELEKKFPEQPQFKGITSRLPPPLPPPPAPPGPGIPGYVQPDVKTASLEQSSASYRKLTPEGVLEPQSKVQQDEQVRGEQTLNYLKSVPSAAENTLLKGAFGLPESFAGGKIAKDAVIAGTLELGGFFKGLTGLDLNIEPDSLAKIEQRRIDPKVADVTGQVVGGLALLGGMGKMLQAAKAGDVVLNTFAKTPQVARFLAAGTRAGVEFGGAGALKEGVRQVQDGTLDLTQFGKVVLKDTALGFGFGGVQAATAGRIAKAVPDALFQAAGASAYGFGTSYLQNHDLVSSAISGGIAGLYALAGAKDATEAQKLGAYKTAINNVGNAAHAEASTRGYSPEDAATLAETAKGKFTDFVNKIQGQKVDIRNWDKISSDVYDEMSKVFEANAPKPAAAVPQLEGPPAETNVPRGTEPAPAPETGTPKVETPPVFGETPGGQTTFAGTVEPSGKPEAINPNQPGLFGEQAKPAFEVPPSAIENAPKPPATAPAGEQGALPLEATETPSAAQPAQPGAKPIKVDEQGVPIRRPGSVVATVDTGGPKPIKITHRQVLDEATGLMNQAVQEYHDKKAGDLLPKIGQIRMTKELRFQGGIEHIPGWIRGKIFTLDPKAPTLDEKAQELGMSEAELRDYLEHYNKNPITAPEQKLGAYYDQAQRNLEYYAQEGVGSGAAAAGGEPANAFFSSVGRVRRPAGGEASVGSQPIDKFEQIETPQMQKARSEFKLSEKARKIVEKYASRVGERYLPRGAQGVFYPKTDNIRVMALNNLSTVAHEVTHYLDHKFNVVDPLITPKSKSKSGNPVYDSKYAPIRKKLTDLYVEYYAGAKADHPLALRMREGLATLLQKYVETPTKIKEKYGSLVDAFLKEGGQFYRPEFKELINDMQGIVFEYQSLDPLEKVGARVTSKFQQSEIRDSYLDFADKFVTEIIDNVYPLEKMAKQAGVQRTAADPSLWARQYSNSTSLVLQNMRGKSGFWIFSNGGFKKIYPENIRDLVETLQEKGLTDDFGKWLVARRQVFAYRKLDELKGPAMEAAAELKRISEMARRGMMVMKSKREIAELKKAVEDYKRLRDTLKHDAFDRGVVEKAYADNASTFKPYEELFDKFTQANLAMLADPQVGLMTEKQYNELSKQEGYASYKRDIYDEILGGEEPVQRKGPAGTKPSSLIGRRGSELTILNPLYSMIRDHAEIVRKSLKQIVINKVAALAEQFPDLFQRTELKPMVDPKTGVISYPQERDPNLMMARNTKGERVPFLVSREIQQVISDVLDYQNVHIFEKFMRSASRLFTSGTTAFYPLFAPTNFLIDQITASAQTRTGYIPIYDSLANVGKALLKRDSQEAQFFHEYLALGGEKQTFAGWTDKQPDELMAAIAGEKSGLDKFFDVLQAGGKILSAPSAYSEIATRAAEYIKSRKQGNPQVVALEDAGRVTVPFHHMGRFGGGAATKGGKLTIGQTAIRSVPFFNPGIQTIAHYIRILKGKDTKNRALFVTLAAIASTVASSYWMMKKATPTQKNLYKDLEPGELSNYIYLPSPDGKRLIKIRVDQTMTVLGVLINMAMWDMVEKTDYKVGDYVSAATAFLPDQVNLTSPQRMFLSIMPQIVKPLINVIYNKKDWPQVRPLISLGLENKEPRLQFNDSTSKFGKWLGDKLNLSPIKIDYLIEGYLGRLSRPFIGKDVTNPFLRDWYFTAGRNLSDYYEASQVSDQLWNSFKTGGRKFSDKEVAQIVEQQGQVRAINKMLDVYRKIQQNKTVPPAEQEKTLSELRDNILDEVAQFRQAVKVR